MPHRGPTRTPSLPWAVALVLVLALVLALVLVLVLVLELPTRGLLLECLSVATAAGGTHGGGKIVPSAGETTQRRSQTTSMCAVAMETPPSACLTTCAFCLRASSQHAGRHQAQLDRASHAGNRLARPQRRESPSLGVLRARHCWATP